MRFVVGKVIWKIILIRVSYFGKGVRCGGEAIVRVNIIFYGILRFGKVIVMGFVVIRV